MIDKFKIKVSSFVANILENDALRFGFMKNGKSNKNALLNKLIPTLVEIRKARRNEMKNILKNEYNRTDSEIIYNAINTVIDRVYFNDEELNVLEEYIWIRASKETIATYSEIQKSETKITAEETSVYLRGLLNEYSRLPQYKREAIVFDKELDVFSDACYTHCVLNFCDKETQKYYVAFAFDYCYGYLYDQTNYCIIFDIPNKMIKAIPLSRMQYLYTVREKYEPSEFLIEQLRAYADACCFEKEINIKEEEHVF